MCEERQVHGTAEGAQIARWKTCLHEAGHVVSGKVLLKHTSRAIVFGDGGGVADVGGEGGVPFLFEDALTTAAGGAAESLADLHPVPDLPLPVPLEVVYPDVVEPKRLAVRKMMTDEVAVARWCIAGIETQPDRWANRFHWIRREARLFVARHQREIVEVATVLFGRGIVTLPAEPAKEEGMEPC
jgi:hypothetical protein